MDLLMFQELHTRFHMVDTIDILAKFEIEIVGMKNDILRLNKCFNPECHDKGIYVSLDRNIFQCKDCNIIGDQFELLRRHLGLSRKEIWGFLNFLFGYLPPTITESEADNISLIIAKLDLQAGTYVSVNSRTKAATNGEENKHAPSVSPTLESSEDVLKSIIKSYDKIEAYSEKIPRGNKLEDLLSSIITHIGNFQNRLNEKPDCLQLARDLVIYNNKMSTFLNNIHVS